jgi:hypothetical protein
MHLLIFEISRVKVLLMGTVYIIQDDETFVKIRTGVTSNCQNREEEKERTASWQVRCNQYESSTYCTKLEQATATISHCSHTS